MLVLTEERPKVMSTSDVHDVLIVGAGPAGAWTAYRLASSGMRVMLVDGSHPREKPCGGGVTGRALSMVQAAIPQRSLGSVRIGGATFTHDDRTVHVPLSGDDSGYPPLVVAGRREFDGALLSAAVAAGAEWKRSRVAGIARQNGGWEVETRDGRYSARWLIGADGVNSLVRRRLSTPFPRDALSIATGYFVKNRSSQEIVVAFEDDPPGYLWSFPRPDHLAVGMCAQADETTAPALQQLAARWIADHVGPNETLERYSWPIPSLDEAALTREHPAGPGWMLVGDAAGLVDPITREGIYFALQSAELAAESLVVRRGDPARRYVDRIRSDIHAELIRAARLKAHFFQPRFISLLVTALCRSSRIRTIMADLVAGRQSYQALRGRLLKTFEWKLMLELFG